MAFVEEIEVSEEPEASEAVTRLRAPAPGDAARATASQPATPPPTATTRRAAARQPNEEPRQPEEEWPREAKAAMIERMGQLEREIRVLEKKLARVRREKSKTKSMPKNAVLQEELRQRPDQPATPEQLEEAEEPLSAEAALRAPPVTRNSSLEAQHEELKTIRARLDSLTSLTVEAEAEIYAAVAQRKAIKPALRDVLAQVYNDVTPLMSSGVAVLSTGAAEGKALVRRSEALAERVKCAIELIDETR